MAHSMNAYLTSYLRNSEASPVSHENPACLVGTHALSPEHIPLVAARIEASRASAMTRNDFIEHSPLTYLDSDRATFSITGFLGASLPSWMTYGGYATDCVEVASLIDALPDSVSQVDFLIETPGGSINGAFELAKKIGQMDQKTTGFSSTLAASAGLTIASQVDVFGVVETATVGSMAIQIGPIMDYSEMYSEMGIHVFAPRSGSLKNAGMIQGVEVSEADKAYFTERVQVAAELMRSITDSRRQISESVYDGRLFLGVQAVDLGVADISVQTIQEFQEFIQ